MKRQLLSVWICFLSSEGGSVLEQGFQALPALEEPQPLHLLLQALEPGGAHADTAVGLSVS